MSHFTTKENPPANSSSDAIQKSFAEDLMSRWQRGDRVGLPVEQAVRIGFGTSFADSKSYAAWKKSELITFINDALVEGIAVTLYFNDGSSITMQEVSGERLNFSCGHYH